MQSGTGASRLNCLLDARAAELNHDRSSYASCTYPHLVFASSVALVVNALSFFPDGIGFVPCISVLARPCPEGNLYALSALIVLVPAKIEVLEVLSQKLQGI